MTKRAKIYLAKQIINKLNEQNEEAAFSMLHAWNILNEFCPTLSFNDLKEMVAYDQNKFERKVLI